MDLESVVLQLDPRSVLAATTEANKAVESWEKGTVGAGERMQRALEHQSDMLLKVHDKSREATERLTRSIIAQNEAYGRSPIEQEIMKRDRLIKKLGDEKSMVDAVRASYAAKIKVMEAEAAGGAGGSGFNARYAFFGAKDLMEGRTKFATAELANELMRMRGAALGIGLVVTAIAAIGFAAYEVTKKVQELRDAEEKLRGEFSRLADSNRLENTELELSNTKLENLLAKLQHKPGNAAKEALEEAAVAAGHLADKLDTAIGKFYELLKKNEVSGIMQLFAPSDKDLAQLVGGATGLGGMRASVYSALEKGEDPTKALASYRMTVAAQLKQAEYSQAHPMTSAQRATAGYRAMGPAGAFGITAAILPNEDETGRIEKLHALMQQIDDVTRSYALETEHGKLAGAVGRAQDAAAASKPQDEALKEFRRQAQEFERKGDEAELSAIGKIYYQRDLLLKQAEKLKGVEADIAGIRKAADKQASEEFAKSYAAFNKIAGGETSEKRQRAMASAIRSSLSGYDKDQETQRTIDRIEMQSEVGVLNRRASGARAAVGASGLTGMDAIRATYQIRIDLAQQLAGVEAARIAKEDDADKKRIDNAKMVADVQRETAEAQQEAMLKEMELQKQQFEGLKRDTEGLWSTLLTHPGKFGKQLANTVHSAVIKPVAEGMANMTASVLHPIIYGANGNGGIASMFGSMFGGKSASKPMDRLFKEPLPVMIVSGGSMPSGGGVSAETPQSMIQSVMAHPATRTILTSVMSAGMMAAPIMAGGAPSVAPNYVPAMYGSAVSGTAVGSGGGYFGGGASANIYNLPINHTGTSGTGFNPLAMLHAGGNSMGLPSLSSLKDSFWNNSWQSGGGKGSAIKSGSFGGDLKGGITSPGAASLMEGVGMPLAMSGLTGNRRGTWGGIAESTTGGALAGAGIGTMIMPGIGTAIGAGVGAVAGFITGGLEKALGIVSPETKAKQQVKSLYNISINDGMAKQIADLAQSKYGGNVSIAVRDPDTRKMLMLYAQSTGQKFPLSAGTPQAGYLAESGGNLYQQASYVNGVATTFQSSLPVLGGLGAGNYYPNANGPNTSGGAGGTSIALNINGQPITPEFVMDSSLAAQGSSYGRVQSAANLNVPGLMTGT